MPKDTAVGTLLLYLALSLLAGIATAFQPGVNSRFAQAAGHPIHGGVINFAVGLGVMLIVWAIASRAVGAPTPDASRLSAGPWWMWVGGVLGAFFVTTAVIVTPRVGTANYLAAMIAGQLAASLVIDRLGLMNLPQIPITPLRLFGVVLVAGGVACIKFGE